MPFEDLHNSGVFDRVNGIYSIKCACIRSCIGSGNVINLSSSNNRRFLGDRGVLQASKNHEDSISTFDST